MHTSLSFLFVQQLAAVPLKGVGSASVLSLAMDPAPRYFAATLALFATALSAGAATLALLAFASLPKACPVGLLASLGLPRGVDSHPFIRGSEFERVSHMKGGPRRKEEGRHRQVYYKRYVIRRPPPPRRGSGESRVPPVVF